MQVGATQIAWIAASVVVMVLVGIGLGRTTSPFAWGTALVVYVLSGALAFLDPVEKAFARWVFWLREPDTTEHRRLGTAWKHASTPEAVASNDIAFWLRRGPQLRSPGLPGRLFAVPQWAIDLPAKQANQLSAVISVEAARTVTGWSRLDFVVYWYELPARAALRALYWVTIGAWWWEQELSARRIGRTQSFWEGAMMAVAVLANLWFVLAFWENFKPGLLLVVVPFVQQYLRRRAALAADQVASAGGHRDALVAALRTVDEPGADRRILGVLRDLPNPRIRIEHLQAGTSSP